MHDVELETGMHQPYITVLHYTFLSLEGTLLDLVKLM
jgi:hypothetical protein